MTTDLVATNDVENGLAHFSADQMNVLRTVICKEANDNEILFFAQVCRAKNLDAFGQQIFLVKRKGKDGPSLTVQTGIDGFRAVAARTGEYAGNDEPVFKYALENNRPTAASVTVWRLIQGARVPFTATARWEEFYPGDAQGFMWKAKPHVMLGKCAEAQALRKGFPNECGGLYEPAELEQTHEEPKATARAQDLNARFLGPKPKAEENPRADAILLAKMVRAFEEIGIDGDAIADKLRITREDIPSTAQLDELRLWYKEIVEEQKTP